MLTKQRLLTPGPTPLPERVRLAMAVDMIHHRKPAFTALLAEVQAGLQELFGTANPVISLAASGTGAMTAAVCGLFALGEKVLVVEGGIFGERWTKIARMHGLEPVVLSVPWGQGVDPEDVKAALDADASICGVLVQHSETSTGAAHPVEAIAAITRERSVLLVVDGISAVSLMPCPMEEWGIDCLLTGSQKGLMLPPGLALIALSDRAWKKAESIPARNFYFNLLAERKSCLQGETVFTPAISLMVGLAESLAMFREVGLKSIYDKQWALCMMTRAGIRELGLNLFAEQSFAWGLTSVLLPEGMQASKLAATAFERSGVVMAIGQGALKERIVRIGHMGWLDYGDILAGLYAFADAFIACGGYLGSRSYLEKAMEAYQAALLEGHPRNGGILA